MACGFDKGLIAAHFDGETTPEERLLVERHLAMCSECAANLSSMRELSASLQPLKGASAPMSIAEGVMRKVRPARPVRRPWIQWGLSAAAAIVLAIGTFYMMDRAGSPAREETIAKSEPAAANRLASRELPAEDSSKSKALIEPAKEVGADAPAAKPSGEIPPAPPPSPPPPSAPRTEAEEFEAKRGGVELRDKESPEKKKDETAMALEKNLKKPITPVLRITSADHSVVRAEVQAFLKERKLKSPPPGAPLLGRGAAVHDRYLQLDLTDEESKELEKRLASLKAGEVAAGSFEDEKKRVAEEETWRQKTLGVRSGDDAKDADKSDQEYAKPNGDKDRKRGVVADKAEERKKIILVFEPAPQKK